MTLVPGTTLGPYRAVAPLGVWGMARVYRARARLEREARTVAGLNAVGAT